MTRPARLRSVLFLPASNPRAIEKARESAADAVVLDLEDAVAPEAKADAREQALAALNQGFPGKVAALRINGLDTPWAEADLAAARASRADAIVAPKIDDRAALERFLSGIDGASDGVAAWAMVETCRAVLNLAEIAAGGGRLAALLLGVNDLSKDMGCRAGPDRAPLQTAMALTVTAARAHGLIALDGVYNALEDDDGLAREAAQGRAFGFHGKTLIHPRQIAAANAAFSPSTEELAFARAVVAAFDAAPDKGAIRVEGKMVERLHLDEARRVLAFAD